MIDDGALFRDREKVVRVVLAIRTSCEPQPKSSENSGLIANWHTTLHLWPCKFAPYYMNIVSKVKFPEEFWH